MNANLENLAIGHNNQQKHKKVCILLTNGLLCNNVIQIRITIVSEKYFHLDQAEP